MIKQGLRGLFFLRKFRIFANKNTVLIKIKKLSVVLLVVSVSLVAQQKSAAQEKQQQPSEQEMTMVQRINEAQMSGSDSDFYEAHQTYIDYLESRQEWEKYYRTWLNRVIYEVNHKHFHRAFSEIHHITEHIREHHQEKYLYISNMGLGFFYNGRNQPETGEKFFRRALQGIDVEEEPVSVFNIYLSLAQSLSFKRPAEAMACLDSLPQQMLVNPMYESGVLGYRCIIANKMGDREAFSHYFAKYDSIRQNLPAQFNAANLQQVMVCHYLMQNDYQQALAWCDSLDVPLVATELRINVYEQMGDWKRAFRASELKDSLVRADEREALELHMEDMAHDIDLLQAEQDKAEIRHTQLVIVGLMAAAIIALLIGMLVYRHKKNRRLKEQFLLLQEARRKTEAGQAIRRAFVTTIQQKLKSPINVLRGYARIFNNPDFLLKPEDRPKRYNDILTAARSIESLIDPVLDSFAQGTTGITDEERIICMEALRSPLLTLINTAEIIIDGRGQIPRDEYLQLRADVCHNAYHVATSTHQLILFSLYGDDMPTPKQDRIGLNEVVHSILNSYDRHPLVVDDIDNNRSVTTAFKTDVADDVMVSTSPLLQDLLNCLLNNADKYVTGGTVLVSCHDDADGTYSISVTNEGPIIPADDAERIFEPFVRLSSDEHSLGIGLPLARHLAISMGYNVTLDLEYNNGARFVVTGI
jgi:signal transduction histidine kinase